MSRVERRPTPRGFGPLAAALIVAALALAGAGLAGQRQEARNTEVERAALHELAQHTVADIQARMRRYDAGLRGLRGAVMAAGEREIRQSQVTAYVHSRNFAQEFPGARRFGIVWRVSAADEAAFVANARKDHRPDFKVYQFAPHSGERKLVAFAEPNLNNEAGLGLDLASEPARDATVTLAARSGESMLSLPIRLFVAPAPTPNALLLALPIYDSKASLATPESREAAAMGWTYAALVIDDVLAGLQGQGQLYELSLDDLPEGGTGEPIRFYGQPSTPTPDGASRQEASIEFDMRGRRWLAHFTGTPAFVEGLHLSSPRSVALITGGTGLLLALSVYFWATARARARKERLEVARRAAIVEGSEDAIIGATLDGVITEWNAGAQRLFGYAADEALGAKVEDLLLPPDCLADEAQFRATIASGRRVPAFDTHRRHRDGTLIAVSLTAGPILDVRGACVGMAKTLRDTREAQRARAELAALNASLEQQVAGRTAELVRALRDNTALLQTLDSFAIVAVSDHDGHITEANPHFCRVSGYTAYELIGRSPQSLASPTHGEAFWNEVHRQLDRGEPWRGEICNLAKDGSPYWTDTIVAPFLDADGRVERFISISVDVTPIKGLQQDAERARLATEEANRFLQEVTDRLPLRIAYLDREHRFRFVNAAQCEAYALPREALLGRHPHEFVAGQPPAHLADVFQQVLGGRAHHYEAEISSPTGLRADYEVRLVPDQREGAVVHGYYAVATDISVRKRAEQELQQTLTTLRAVLDSATQVSILSVDLDGRINLFNRGAEQLTGYAAQEAIGHDAIELLHDASEVEARRATLQAQLGHPVGRARVFVDKDQIGQSSQWTYRRKDGSGVPVALAVTQIRDDAGTLFGLLGIAHDVSERLAIEQSLREAMNRANHANEAKSAFLANMSHEIRTPMNAVIGLSYLLGHTSLTPEQGGFVDKIKRASKSLLGIINDVLDLSKIEAEEMHIECAPFSLTTLLDELGELMSLQAQAKQIGFTVTRPQDLVEVLDGDATRLRQVLTNLISNAIKFTNSGEVRLDVQQLADGPSGDGGDHGTVAFRFTVRDTGIGIPAEALERIFQPFAQADASTTRRYGGTGLGLSIVRQLVTLMGGQVEARSEPGVGSEFSVNLQLPRSHAWRLPQDSMAPLTDGEALTGLRILVVDDSELNLEVARRILELEGATVTLAENGQQAIDCLLGCPDGYDLVLMDMQMPVLDGHDATRRIRSGLGLTQLPIVALTAGVTVGEQQRAAAAGMNDLLGKPFEPEELVGCILRHVGRGRARSVPVAEALGPPWPPLLGVDMADAQRRLSGDLALFRSLLRRMLQDFADLEIPQTPAAEAMSDLARRMHRLKGTAGTLGVRDVGEAAGATEEACLSRSLNSVARCLLPLAEHLRHLREATQAFVMEPEDSDEATGQAPPLDDQALTELLGLLHNSDLAALQRLELLKPTLRQCLPPGEYDNLRRHMDELDFNAAEQLLSRLG